jgi:5-formyltetrahydrofolate cyclo-ligase
MTKRPARSPRAAAAADSKKSLRRTLLAQRAAIGAAEHAALSADLRLRLAAWLRARGVRQIFAFMPHKGEPDVTKLVAERGGLRFGWPVVAGPTEIAFYELALDEPAVVGRFGIKEPDPVGKTPLVADAETAILVPALAVDRGGHRLGYGGGFYDRYLATAGAAVTVGVVFSRFVVPALAAEGHDRRLAFLATEQGVVACG